MFLGLGVCSSRLKVMMSSWCQVRGSKGAQIYYGRKEYYVQVLLEVGSSRITIGKESV